MTGTHVATRARTKALPRTALAYLEQRASAAHTALIVAKEQRLGATVIKRRERKWIMAIAKLAAATPATRRRAAA